MNDIEALKDPDWIQIILARHYDLEDATNFELGFAYNDSMDIYEEIANGHEPESFYCERRGQNIDLIPHPVDEGYYWSEDQEEWVLKNEL